MQQKHTHKLATK